VGHRLTVRLVVVSLRAIDRNNLTVVGQESPIPLIVRSLIAVQLGHCGSLALFLYGIWIQFTPVPHCRKCSGKRAISVESLFCSSRGPSARSRFCGPSTRSHRRRASVIAGRTNLSRRTTCTCLFQVIFQRAGPGRTVGERRGRSLIRSIGRVHSSCQRRMNCDAECLLDSNSHSGLPLIND
jgi:hypothetical protein